MSNISWLLCPDLKNSVGIFCSSVSYSCFISPTLFWCVYYWVTCPSSSLKLYQSGNKELKHLITVYFVTEQLWLYCCLARKSVESEWQHWGEEAHSSDVEGAGGAVRDSKGRQHYTSFLLKAQVAPLTCQCRRCKRHKFDPWVGGSLGVGNGNPL